MLRGPAPTPLSLLRGAATALRAMDRPRYLALLASAGLLASLFAPWYGETVTAHGLSGPRRLSESFTGWDALSAVGLACVAIAVIVWGLLFVRSGTVVSGLGADGRRAARARADGLLVSLAGLTGTVWLLVKLADHPGATANAVGATTTVSIRWGVVLALLFAVALVGLGAMIAGAAPSLARLSPRSRASRVARGVAIAEPPTPDFDFAISDAPLPAAPSVRRPGSGQPRGRHSGREPGTISRSSR